MELPCLLQCQDQLPNSSKKAAGAEGVSYMMLGNADDMEVSFVCKYL